MGIVSCVFSQRLLGSLGWASSIISPSHLLHARAPACARPRPILLGFREGGPFFQHDGASAPLVIFIPSPRSPTKICSTIGGRLSRRVILWCGASDRTVLLSFGSLARFPLPASRFPLPVTCLPLPVSRSNAVTAGVRPTSGVSTVAAGTVLGRYRLLDRIGEGGMGEVWRAHDDNLDRDVAIKMLLHGTLGNATTVSCFRREALVLSRLSHPALRPSSTSIPAWLRVPGHGYVAGDTPVAARVGSSSDRRLSTLGAAIADGLDNAHRTDSFTATSSPATLR